jgi:prepilin-type N-terminal cleavage/methylation domain-containing protein
MTREWKKMVAAKRCGVSLVELMVVLTIIAAAMAMMLPAVQHVRQRARGTACKNNHHQMNLAIQQYLEAHKKLPPAPVKDLVSGWTIEILPFLELGNLRNAVPPGTPLSKVPSNLGRLPHILRCPVQSYAASSVPGLERTHYVYVSLEGRKSYLILDATEEYTKLPFLAGPEMPYETASQMKSPHDDGGLFSKLQ